MNNEVNQHLENLPESVKETITELVNYTRKNHPDLPEVISFQMPTFKLGEKANRNYISFGYGKNHISLHTMDFDYINILREQLSKPGKGKGCVNVAFDKVDEIELLKNAVDVIVARNQKNA